MNNSFYIYQNWVTHKNSGKIHKAGCNFCNNGDGMLREKEQGKSGVWIGPFDDYDLAEEYLTKFINEKLQDCTVCRNNK